MRRDINIKTKSDIKKKRLLKNNIQTPIIKSINLPKVLLITTYPPRECGIATYTQDLKNALEDKFEDISNEVMRFSPNEKRKWAYRFQVVYSIFFYGLLSLHRLVSKDFEQLSRYSKLNLIAGQGTTFGKAMFQMILIKLGYYGLMLVLPIVLIDIPWWQTLLGFLSMHYVSGVILALVFQAAHITEETDFFKVNETGSLENSWAVHQMKTTTNFGTESKLFTWFVGGLNHQIEHHLFPQICHMHYHAISKIVKETALEHDVVYNHEKSFYSALSSHFKFMRKLGLSKYDKEFLE